MQAVRLETLLGGGGGGCVYAGYDARSGRPLAIKVIALSGDAAADAAAQAEAARGAQLRHRHVVRLYGVRRAGGGRELELVMQRAGGGTVADLIGGGRGLPEAVARRYVRGAAGGLRYLHAAPRRLVHRDVKPANMLLGERGRVMLGDLGSARALPPSGSPALAQTTLVGTPAYMAPELLDGGACGPAADVWALGVSAFEMVAGRRPFGASGSASAVAVLYEVAAAADGGGAVAVPWGSLTPSPELRDLVARCLEADPQRRPTCERLLKHPWLRGAAAGSDSDSDSAASEEDDDGRDGSVAAAAAPLFDAADLAAQLRPPPPQQQQQQVRQTPTGGGGRHGVSCFGHQHRRGE